MEFFTITLIALSLAVDSFAASFSGGTKLKVPKVKTALKVALLFGIFQGTMPIIGWFAGTRIKELITNVDHWIAFGLLLAVGSKMIYEAVHSEKRDFNLLSNKTVIILSIATSIDALAVGISFAFLKAPILISALTIGIITIILSFAGVLLGCKLRKMFTNQIEIIAGTILILIGLKILFQHLF